MKNISMEALKALVVKSGMKLRKISPELALAGGIVCGVAAVVTACMASRKVDGVIDEANANLNDIQKLAEEDKLENPKKECFYEYRRMGWKLVKLYWPTVVLGTASVGLILYSHGILKKRHLQTLAAYNALDEAFKGYRKRVAEAVGDEAEKTIMAGGKVEKNIKVENTDGGEDILKGSNIVFNEKKNSPYEFDFNRYTAPLVWEPTVEYNEMRLRSIQNYFNDVLQARGHVFLNEILDELGMKRTPAGAVCGWVKGCGDNYIDFGYMDGFIKDWNIDSDLCRKNIHLNFNCDGQIWDMI